MNRIVGSVFGSQEFGEDCLMQEVNHAPTPIPLGPLDHIRQNHGDGVVASIRRTHAYVTHVPSGSQVVLDQQGKVTERYDGRGDGPAILNAKLADESVIELILAGMQWEMPSESTSHLCPLVSYIDVFRFGGIDYRAKDRGVGFPTWSRTRIPLEPLGSQMYRVAFTFAYRVDCGPELSAYFKQDGDASLLGDGTPIYAVKGYSPEFRLVVINHRFGGAILYEADSNPAAETGADLLDIRDKVRSIDISESREGLPILASIENLKTVQELVRMMTSASVDQQHESGYGLNSYYITFNLDDDFEFSGGTRLYHWSSGDHYSDVIEYLLQTVRCGSVMCTGHLGGTGKGRTIYPRMADLWATNRGLFLKRIPEMKLPLVPTWSLQMRGAMEETAMVYSRIEQGLFPAKTMNTPTIHRNAGTAARDALDDPLHNIIYQDNHTTAHIRRIWNDPTWDYERRKLPKGLIKSYLEAGGDPEMLRT